MHKVEIHGQHETTFICGYYISIVMRGVHKSFDNEMSDYSDSGLGFSDVDRIVTIEDRSYGSGDPQTFLLTQEDKLFIDGSEIKCTKKAR